MAATALEGCSSSSPLPTLPLCLGVFFGLLLHGSPQPVMGFRPVTELGAGWCLTICDDDFCLEGRQTSAPAEDMMAIPEWPVLCTACWCFSILLKLLASREAAGTLPPATHTMWAQAVAALQYYTHTQVWPLQRIWCLFEVYHTIRLTSTGQFQGQCGQPIIPCRTGRYWY